MLIYEMHNNKEKKEQQENSQSICSLFLPQLPPPDPRVKGQRPKWACDIQKKKEQRATINPAGWQVGRLIMWGLKMRK